MTDIRKRAGRKGVTYQVRFRGARGYEYRTFETLKEARGFGEDAAAHKRAARKGRAVLTVEDGVQKWLDVCEKEGRNGREPVTAYTLNSYEYLAGIINKYDWHSDLAALTKPDIVEFRSWLLTNYSRDVSHKVLTSFRSMVKELVGRGELAQDVAAGVHVAAGSRYDEPVVIPSERDIQALLAAADRMANSRNRQTQRTWERYRPMLYLAVDSGMRPQEYLALARSSLKETGVEVDRALDGASRKITVTKTRAGRRFIDLSPGTLDMVRHYVEHHSVENDHDLVFPTSTGKWQSVRNWRKRGFAMVCEEAGLIVEEYEDGEKVTRPKFRPYDLRHFYASMRLASHELWLSHHPVVAPQLLSKRISRTVPTIEARIEPAHPRRLLNRKNMRPTAQGVGRPRTQVRGSAASLRAATKTRGCLAAGEKQRPLLTGRERNCQQRPVVPRSSCCVCSTSPLRSGDPSGC